MMRNKLLLILLSGFTSYQAKAADGFGQGSGFLIQSPDSARTVRHSPHRASLYSAMLPGLGQAYNRKYWKIPIVYAALGTSAYFIVMNRTEMRKRQDALTLMLDGDPDTQPAPEFINFPVEVLRAQRNNYRTNRDYSIIAFAGFYLLNVIDAAVDAHFYGFDIDKPLAQRPEKRWNISSFRSGNTHHIGLSWRF